MSTLLKQALEALYPRYRISDMRLFYSESEPRAMVLTDHNRVIGFYLDCNNKVCAEYLSESGAWWHDMSREQMDRVVQCLVGQGEVLDWLL